MRDDNVVAGRRSIQDNLLVVVYTGSSINPEYLVMLRHAERLHGLAIFGFHTFNLQSGSIQIQSLFSLSNRICAHFICHELKLKQSYELILSNRRAWVTEVYKLINIYWWGFF